MLPESGRVAKGGREQPIVGNFSSRLFRL